MKRSILLLMAIVAVIILSGCEKEEIMSQDPNLDDQEITSLKKAKKGDTFTGECNFVAQVDAGTTEVLPNGKTHQKGVTDEWYDSADDWRVTGTSIWFENFKWEGDPFVSNGTVWGKTELFVDDPEDLNAPSCGKWEMSWHGYITDNGLSGSVDAVATGKEGVVKGLIAKWRYTLAWKEAGCNFYCKSHTLKIVLFCHFYPSFITNTSYFIEQYQF